LAPSACQVRIALIMWPFNNCEIRLLPHPGGKRFAFTIIDDTDMATLETVRPIYDYLHSLGLRTTKTVWVTGPKTPQAKPSDAGDTLEREEYAAYIRLARRRGFEIALHNVSSQSSTRGQIAAGIEKFRQIVGEYPGINVHHEKNRENLYFEFAQRGGYRPPSFRSTAFQRLNTMVRRNGHPPVFQNCGCCGEDSRSDYFWGDLCRTTIQYVRSNVFFQDLNTLRCNPLAPYTSIDTPYVNHWFDSSNGQDVRCFNSILNSRNIAALKRECGCSILYTHFGKGFSVGTDGRFDLNEETKSCLRAVAGDPDGWYVPVGEILDRLLAFQRVTVFPLPAGVALTNHNFFDIASVTLLAVPAQPYFDLDRRETIAADERGRIILPLLRAGTTTVLVRSQASRCVKPWYEERGSAWKLDLEAAARKLRVRWFENA